METELSRRGFLTLPFAGFLKREDKQEKRLEVLEANINVLGEVINNNSMVFDNRISELEERMPGVEIEPEVSQV